MDVLLTWVGSRDPGWPNPRTEQREPGPILGLLKSRRFDKVYILANLPGRNDEFVRRAAETLRHIERHFPRVAVKMKPLEVVSVIDHREIFRVTNHACQEILRQEGSDDRSYYVYLSPGTPAMQTVWVLLVQSGLVPARLIEATPPDLKAPGVRTWREVDLSIPDFPQIVSPKDANRRIGILQAQTDNLRSENRSLRAQVKLAEAGAPAPTDGAIAEGFNLRDYLVAQEETMYVRALEQAGNKAATAARLLGIEPPAFRSRAQTLGIRSRNKRT